MRGAPVAGIKQQADIIHVGIGMDASISMEDLAEDVVRVVDGQIRALKEESELLSKEDDVDHEVRVTVYTFSSGKFRGDNGHIKCAFYDKDVFRLPSLADHYTIGRSTALIDAVLTVQAEMAQTAQLYGSHNFLLYVVTDGQENSSAHRPGDLRTCLERLPENWTVAALVPDVTARRTAMQYGFPAGNIKIWDASSVHGLEEAAREMTTASSAYLRNVTRDGGYKSTKSLFVGGDVDASAIKAANLTPLPVEKRKIVMVARTKDTEHLFFEKPINRVTKKRLVPDKAWHVEIKPFVEAAYPPYRVGMAYYELTKSECVTADKQIAVVEVDTNQVYVGAGARQLLKLPGGVCRVKPTLNRDYKIFVESTSLNRHLRVGTQLLLLTS